MKLTGAQSLIRSLEACDVEVVFGLPGGAIPVYLRPDPGVVGAPILVRRVSRAPATPPRATPGPPARSGVHGHPAGRAPPTGHRPVRRLHGLGAAGRHHRQVPSWAIGSDAFQEADTTGITMPVTKHTGWSLTPTGSPGRWPRRSTSPPPAGRAGPGRLPKDILQATTEWSWPSTTDLPGYRPVTRPNGKQVREAAALLRTARRPVLASAAASPRPAPRPRPARAGRAARGPGHHHPDGPRRLPRQPPTGPRHAGMHGNYAAVAALQEPTCWSPSRPFDDRVTGSLATFAPKARIVRADIDPAEIGKNRVADVPIVGDVGLVVEELASATGRRRPPRAGDTEAWQGACAPVEAALPVPLRPAGRRPAQAPARGRAGVGSHRRRGGGGRRGRPAQMYAAQHFRFDRPGPGSTPAGWARWASPCRRPWGPRWAGPTSWWWPSTATAASR